MLMLLFYDLSDCSLQTPISSPLSHYPQSCTKPLSEAETVSSGSLVSWSTVSVLVFFISLCLIRVCICNMNMKIRTCSYDIILYVWIKWIKILWHHNYIPSIISINLPSIHADISTLHIGHNIWYRISRFIFNIRLCCLRWSMQQKCVLIELLLIWVCFCRCCRVPSLPRCLSAWPRWPLTCKPMASGQERKSDPAWAPRCWWTSPWVTHTLR